ncbi:hypothetical protein CQW23_32770 [Capsicum baccatum]|uniref:Retrotransposon gag domain-containing protein n=1 Tax=Capsicum baccatum TaxID=33114 RepID=A0A2G2V3U5_CAPBA|nr:hypothetical protein CQW23_32770 [Capsicum baccatum]
MVSDDSYGTLHLFAIEVRLEVIGKKAKKATFISGTEATKISKEIQKVEKRRIVKSTLFNERSSRSHCMVFIQYMPHTRSSGQPLLPINPEPQRIGRMEVQHEIERTDAQQEQARLASLAAAQVHQQNIDNPERAINPDDEDLGDDELLNPRHAAEINAFRLRLFPLSLSWEATLWLNGLTTNSITNWRQLKDTFLERFFLPSKRAELRDEISNFRQLPTEALHETWERFKTKLMRCPNHHMTNVHLMEILYRSLNLITKPVVDNAAGGSFMDLTFGQASNMLDRITKQSKAWHTRDSEVASPTLSIGMTANQRRREEERDQDMAHLKTQVDLLTKHLLSGKTEKVKAVALKGRDESDSEEEANYLNNQGGFRGNTQGNQGRNYYDKSGNKDQGSWKNKNEKSGLYVPPGRRDTTTSGSESMEDMMAKLLKGVEATSAGVTDVINDLSSIKKLVDSYSTSIKQIEQQLSQLSAALNQRKVGTLPSDTVQNPRNDGSCMAITTRSGMVLETSSKGKQVVDEEADIDDKAKREAAVETTHDVHDITPKALEQMPSAIATRSLVWKKADPGAFTIPCTVGSLNFAKSLCHLGASINLMPLSVYRKFGLGNPIPTNMRLVMADRSVK